MMNQGANTQTTAPLDPNSVENRYVVDSSQVQTSSYHYSTTGSDAASWTTHRVDNHDMDNGYYSNSRYLYAQPTEPAARSIQDGADLASFSSSTSGTTVAEGYKGYTSYASSTDPYGYGSTGYPGYYNGYQQQPNQSYSQPTGAHQNTGAPYQSLSSFQNTGSFAGSASYSGTYYNPADYQTSGGYASTGFSNQTSSGYLSTSYSNQTSGSYSSDTYNNQTTSWNQGNRTNCISNAYSNYSPATSGAYSSTPATATSLPYQQHYKLWADYYSQTEVTCAPGTENVSVSGTSSQSYAASGVNSGIPTNSLPAQSYVQSWRPDTSSSRAPPPQPGPAVAGAHDNYWTHTTPNFQNHHPAPMQTHYQSSLDVNLTYDTFQDQQKPTFPQALNFQSSIHLPAPSFQTAPSLHSTRVSKLQITTNPRIASNLQLGFPKTDKDISTASTAIKPACVSVSQPKPGSPDSMLKPSTFPKSLRGYVERALTRCKSDKEKVTCQAALKEIITKATADGTLYTRDWDIEPLFPVPNTDTVSNRQPTSTPISPLQKRSLTRRSKSRWEPLTEEKPVVKSPSVVSNAVRFGDWSHLNEKDKKTWGHFQKVDAVSNFKSPFSEQNSANKKIQRPLKRQRFGVGVNAVVDGDVSSDSDNEQSLTAYYSTAMAVANSAEEKKRRENRSKRFDKGQGHRRENNFFKLKNASVGNLYSRRATTLVLGKSFDGSGSLDVEDIDWDASTVKGTCQEIEKRYLRLTSAPDPSTVRPEDVLEKALLMVQNCQKNYLYICDQLKSIRQDLTVQRIRNQLTVKVYETHARLALEAGDLPEYNQCLSQLKILYTEGIEGCHLEFAAYNLLYQILHSNNNRELLLSMSRLSDEAKKDEAVKHALSVRTAVTSGNYVKFFRLYNAAPNLNACLMDLYVEKMHFKAVSCMSRAYRPTVPVTYIAQVLGFTGAAISERNDEMDTDGSEDCVEWLKAHGASLTIDNNGEMQLDAKASSSSLYMPEPEDAVAHGDPNLAVNDFFARSLS